ncbi:hypothetical protein NOR_04196 [Metarhizium rileyi]|uniref:Uncharacterized protein n=1 Tax=Metarhizium rileyi (strain RCEF 4871) TaxID=1649241 RepID=A0A167EB61_METRR|nr:hypothetical protein NOR_04196 [Metarhizium rileyi RCEF 4871]TWU72895.1 hypothetical protein ED733_004339 [Metarhizium rileyi]
MKYTLPVFIAAATAISAAEYQRLHLPDPQNWIPGSSLFPGNVIAGYNANYNEHDKESWAALVLERCESYADCTSSATYSAINSGTPKYRAWFGYLFRGGQTAEADYERAAGVEDSVIYVRE